MTATCRDPHHISEDRPECTHPEDDAWDQYVESTGVRLCLPCADTDCHGCVGGECDCAHFWIQGGVV